MRALLSLLATFAWLGALGAVYGAAILNANVMGVSGLGAAVSALAWGVIRAVTRGEAVDDDGACPICDHPFGEFRHACIGPDLRPSVVDRGRMNP